MAKKKKEEEAIFARLVLANHKILRDPSHSIPILQDLATRSHLAVTRALDLLKAYVLYRREVGSPIPFTKELIDIILLVVTNGKIGKPRSPKRSRDGTLLEQNPFRHELGNVEEENNNDNNDDDNNNDDDDEDEDDEDDDVPKESPLQRYERKQILYLDISNFYNNKFLLLLHSSDTFNTKNLCYLRPYWLKSIVTMFKNNLKMNLQKYLRRFMYAYLCIHDRVESIREELKFFWESFIFAVNYLDKDELFGDEQTQFTADDIKLEKKKYLKEVNAMIASMKREVNVVVGCIMGKRNEELPEEFSRLEPLVHELRSNLPPPTKSNHTVQYDIQLRPLEYLQFALCIVSKMEEMTAFTSIRLPNIFSLKHSCIVDFFTLDSRTLLQCLSSSAIKNEVKNKKLIDIKEKIWNEIFKINKSAFRASFAQFRYLIQTDGFAIHILFTITTNIKDGYSIPPYIHNLSKEELEDLKKKKLVAYDPNKGNLVFAVDGDDRKATVWRMTAISRWAEGKMKFFSKKRKMIRTNEKVQGISIMDIEKDLMQHNSKTLNLEKFLAYVSAKSNVRMKISKVYDKLCWRKFRFDSKIALKKVEKKHMDSFKNTFGTPAEVIVAAGNYSSKTYHMKGKRPVPGVGVRKLFVKYGYRLVLVDEYHTSKLCCKCGSDGKVGVNVNCVRIKHPHHFRSDEVTSWAILKCTTCGTFWNRDRNSANNIWRIAHSHIERGCRPLYLCRK